MVRFLVRQRPLIVRFHVRQRGGDLKCGVWIAQFTAKLIARIRGCAESDPNTRIQALMLISSLLAFQSGRSVSLRAMQWSTIGQEELAMVLTSLGSQIDAIGRDHS
jgi:hypothetical protein